MFIALLTAKKKQKTFNVVWLQYCCLPDLEIYFIFFATVSLDFVQHGAGNEHLIVFPSVLLAVKKSDWFWSCAAVRLKLEQLQKSENVCNEVEL